MALETLLLAFALTDVTITGGKKKTNQPTRAPVQKGCNPYGRAPLVAGTKERTNTQTNNMEDGPSYEAINFSLT
jgi:hypothetical protein